MNGIISNTKTFRWIKKYETKEAWPDAIDWSHAVCLPLASDVLLGRGKPYQNYSGNVQLRSLICDYWDAYDTVTKKGGKTEIAERVVDIVKERGGRFLKLNEKLDWWFPVSNKDAVGKVSQGFRKKREMNVQGGVSRPCSGTAVKKEDTAKRTKCEAPVSTPVQNVGGDDLLTPDEFDFLMNDDNQSPWNNVLTTDEFDFLMQGLAKPHTDSFHESTATSTTVSSTAGDPSELSGFEDAFENFLAKVSDPFPSMDDHPLTVDLPSEINDPMLQFLRLHHDCLKSSPEQTFSWLQSQDIMTLADLHEACADTEFVDLDLIPKGGLKRFKHRPFIKDINCAVET
ncbi:MAG: hypothetical protein SGILL_009981 [Bacillariaceae sp.]